jgi:hypothetical protein
MQRWRVLKTNIISEDVPTVCIYPVSEILEMKNAITSEDSDTREQPAARVGRTW